MPGVLRLFLLPMQNQSRRAEALAIINQGDAMKQQLKWIGAFIAREVKAYIVANGDAHYQEFEAWLLGMIKQAEEKLLTSSPIPPELDATYCEAVQNRFRDQLESNE